MIEFAKYTGSSAGKEYCINWHHDLIARNLDRFEAGEIKRLMVFTPPQHGKSEMVSRKLPGYILGRNPDARIIATSYSPDLASRMNRDVQRLIESPAYGRVFPGTRLFGKNVATVGNGSYLRNSDIFEVVDRFGSYRGAGVGGGITGMSADYIIVDDPIKSRDDANSAVYRDKLWDWYTDVLQTRKHNGTGILLTLTRWHEDDLASRLLKKMKDDPAADQWEVISLPAIMDDLEEKHPEDPRNLGEALWEDQQCTESLATTKATSGMYTWEAMYQQRPRPKGGGDYFKRAQIGNFISIVPADVVKWVRAWDLAATTAKESKGSAKTSGVLMGKRKDGTYIVADVKDEQWSASEVREQIRLTAQQDRAAYGNVTIKLPQDPGQAGKAQAQSMVKLLAGFNVKAEPESGSKETRAEPMAAQWQAGNFAILTAPWNDSYIDQLESFPSGKLKDMVDASSSAFNEIEAGGKFSIMDW